MVSKRSSRRSSSCSSSKTLTVRTSMPRMPLRAALAWMRALASAEISSATTLGAGRRQRQREAAVVAERVEQPAVRIAQRRLAVLALIEEQAGLLAAAQVDLVADAPFADRHALGHRAGDHGHLRLEPFERADLGVVAHQDAGRTQPLAEHGDDLGQQALGRLRQRLHHEVVAVAVDDQRRQQVAFAVHERGRRSRRCPATRGTRIAWSRRARRKSGATAAPPAVSNRSADL